MYTMSMTIHRSDVGKEGKEERMSWNRLMFIYDRKAPEDVVPSNRDGVKVSYLGLTRF